MKRILKVVASDIQDTQVDDNYTEWENEMKNNATYQKIDKLCELHGYTLVEALNERYNGGKIMPSISIRPNESKGEWAKYLPPINFTTSRLADKQSQFKIQTIAYGSLTLAEYNLFIQAVNHASLLVEALSEIDLAKLSVWEF